MSTTRPETMTPEKAKSERDEYEQECLRLIKELEIIGIRETECALRRAQVAFLVGDDKKSNSSHRICEYATILRGIVKVTRETFGLPTLAQPEKDIAPGAKHNNLPTTISRSLDAEEEVKQTPAERFSAFTRSEIRNLRRNLQQLTNYDKDYIYYFERFTVGKPSAMSTFDVKAAHIEKQLTLMNNNPTTDPLLSSKMHAVSNLVKDLEEFVEGEKTSLKTRFAGTIDRRAQECMKVIKELESIDGDAASARSKEQELDNLRKRILTREDLKTLREYKSNLSTLIEPAQKVATKKRNENKDKGNAIIAELEELGMAKETCDSFKGTLDTQLDLDERRNSAVSIGWYLKNILIPALVEHKQQTEMNNRLQKKKLEEAIAKATALVNKLEPNSNAGPLNLQLNLTLKDNSYDTQGKLTILNDFIPLLETMAQEADALKTVIPKARSLAKKKYALQHHDPETAGCTMALKEATSEIDRITKNPGLSNKEKIKQLSDYCNATRDPILLPKESTPTAKKQEAALRSRGLEPTKEQETLFRQKQNQKGLDIIAQLKTYGVPEEDCIFYREKLFACGALDEQSDCAKQTQAFVEELSRIKEQSDHCNQIRSTIESLGGNTLAKEQKDPVDPEKKRLQAELEKSIETRRGECLEIIEQLFVIENSRTENRLRCETVRSICSSVVTKKDLEKIDAYKSELSLLINPAKQKAKKSREENFRKGNSIINALKINNRVTNEDLKAYREKFKQAFNEDKTNDSATQTSDYVNTILAPLQKRENILAQIEQTDATLGMGEPPGRRRYSLFPVVPDSSSLNGLDALDKKQREENGLRETKEEEPTEQQKNTSEQEKTKKEPTKVQPSEVELLEYRRKPTQ